MKPVVFKGIVEVDLSYLLGAGDAAGDVAGAVDGAEAGCCTGAGVGVACLLYTSPSPRDS